MEIVELYPHTVDYAISGGADELARYKESHNSDIACATAIREAITSNFDGYRLNGDIEIPVIKDFGIDRVNWVLSHIVQQSSWDGRFSKENKAWAKAVCIPLNELSESEIWRRRSFSATCHVGLIDIFIRLVRREMERKMKMKDVNFLNRKEYSPLNERADKLGNVRFWRADYQHQTIAIGDTKKECTENVRNYIKKKQEEK